MEITKTMERNIVRYLRNPISQLKKNGKGQLMFSSMAGDLIVAYIEEKLKCSWGEAEIQYHQIVDANHFDLYWDAEICVEEEVG